MSSHAGATAVVCVKAVPVGGSFLRIDGDRLTRDGLSHGLDPINEVAVEWAVQARESGAVARVVAVTMGPAHAIEAARRALALGCDDATIVQDPALAGADVRLTARTLAAAVRHAGASLAIFGYESLDGSSGTVPAAVSAGLGWPLLSFARGATIDGDVVRVERDLGREIEVAECDLPAVLTLASGAAEPRFPKLKDVSAARKRDVPTIDLAALGIEAQGMRSRERVTGLTAVASEARSRRTVTAADGPTEIERILTASGVVHE